MRVEYASRYGYEFVESEGNAGYDIHTPVDIYLPPGAEMCVHTGLRLKLHSDVPVFTMIVPRSSAGVKKDLIIKNTIGIVDPSYCGDADEFLVFLKRRSRSKSKYVGKIPQYMGRGAEVYTYRDHQGESQKLDYMKHTIEGEGYVMEGLQNGTNPLLYKAGERFAQLLFLPYNEITKFSLMSQLDGEDRGGIGSTGDGNLPT